VADGAFIKDPGTAFEWVKFRSHLSRGVTVGTMLQDEAFHFLRIGSFLERADNKCEWCGVTNYEYGYRDVTGLYWFPVDSEAEAQRLRQESGIATVRIILTVAHLDHDITNNDPANLAADESITAICRLAYAGAAPTMLGTQRLQEGRRLRQEVTMALGALLRLGPPCLHVPGAAERAAFRMTAELACLRCKPGRLAADCHSYILK
jgi:hypothetical protein